MYKRTIFSIFFLLLFIKSSYGQTCATMNIAPIADVPSVCNTMVLTMAHDNRGLPLLYVANKEAGLVIYDVNQATTPQLLSQTSIFEWGGLDVMNLCQSGDYLFLALGNSFTNPQSAGIAIVNISNPASPVVTSFYTVPGSSTGSGIVAVEGDYAYLGAMRSGLIVFDISDKSSIVQRSQFLPDINYPYPNPPNPNFYNARGLEVKNGIVYLCFDAGGLRVVNCVNPLLPVETGHFANPLLYFPFNLTRAYNNIVLDNNIAYIAVDYCGVEAIDISDTSALNLIGWWNPQNCPNNNWFTSPVHSNEIRINKACSQLYVSTGKSEFYVLDISNPSLPDSCNYFGDVSDTAATWGVNYYDNFIYLAYTCTFGIPFFANYTGLKTLSFNSCTVGIDNPFSRSTLAFPNPAHSNFRLNLSEANEKMPLVKLSDLFGRVLTYIKPESTVYDISSLPQGAYFLEWDIDGHAYFTKLIKQ